jgi:hypothetical protein
MTPDQAVLLLVKSESQTREMFTPADVLPLMEIASRQMGEAASMLRAAIAVQLGSDQEKNSEVRARMLEFAGNLGVAAQLKLATGTTNAMLAFSLNPITAEAQHDPKADMN